jgi:predicted TIM-barrel fold metal-dependent hydrolase
MASSADGVGNKSRWLISVDDHVFEPPDVWQSRVPAQYREQAPHLVEDDAGVSWLFEDQRHTISVNQVQKGRQNGSARIDAYHFRDMRPGCYDPVARLKDMDQAGILASMVFPSFAGFGGQTFYQANDKALALECLRAYNDWMIDEWCGASPGRYIPLMIVPLWNPRAAAGEMERCKAKGAAAVSFIEHPSALGLPSLHDEGRYWDPMMSAATDLELPICIHIGWPTMVKPSPDAPRIVSNVLIAANPMAVLIEWLFSGVFVRFPQLKLCLSEGNIGWIPSALRRAEDVVERQGAWHRKYGKLAPGVLDQRPTQVFREHVYGCCVDDTFGAKNLDDIGVDNVMLETDYPHGDSTWPNSIDVALEMLAGRSDEEIYKVLQGNAQRVFHFEPAAVPTS